MNTEHKFEVTGERKKHVICAHNLYSSPYIACYGSLVREDGMGWTSNRKFAHVFG